MTQKTAIALLGACRATGRKPKNLAVRILATHAPEFRRRAEAGELLEVADLKEYCLRWLRALDLPINGLALEYAAGFAKEFAEAARSLDYHRGLFLGGIAEGQQVDCVPPTGKRFKTDLGNPSVLTVLRGGGSARLGDRKLIFQEVL